MGHIDGTDNDRVTGGSGNADQDRFNIKELLGNDNFVE